MTRVPYPERPDVIARWCICPVDTHTLVEIHDDGSETRRPLRLFDPLCPIHGILPEHDLPEGI